MSKLVDFFTRRRVIVVVNTAGTKIAKIRLSKREFNDIKLKADNDYLSVENYILKAIKNYLEIA
jgi:hypothetical protein